MTAQPLSTPGLCQTLKYLAVRTWADIRDGDSAGVKVGEESITDYLLLALTRAHPNEVEVTKFTRYAEGTKTGADWEWWFTDGNDWFGLRVQAKRLDPVSMSYSGLNKKTKRTLQYNRLIRDAAKDHCFPVYCLYNYWDKPVTLTWPFMINTMQVELLGCTLVGADRVKKIKPGRITKIATISQFSWPWSCLVCCPPSPSMNDSLPYRVKHFIGQLSENSKSIPAVLHRRPDHLQELSQDESPKDHCLAGIVILQENRSRH